MFDFWDHALTWPKIMWKLERKSKTIKIWLNKYNVATEHFLRYIYPPKTVSLIVSNNQRKLIAETQTCQSHSTKSCWPNKHLLAYGIK